MDRDQASFEALDLTKEISITDPVPLFFGTYSHIVKGFYRGEVVAVKVLRHTGVSLNAMKRKVTREREVWTQLNHINIVPMYGYTQESNVFGLFGALISPWHERGDAEQLLQKHGASLSLEERKALWKGVAEGVAYLHKHDPLIIHGDLKPGNILIDSEGTPKLCDFGLARIFLAGGNSGMTTTSPHTGTDRYLAYELVISRDASLLSTASDVYALGCIGLYFLFLQRPYAKHESNFFGQIFQDIRDGIPPAIRPVDAEAEDAELWDILEISWNPDPHKRLEVSVILKRLDYQRNNSQTDQEVFSCEAKGCPGKYSTSEELSRHQAEHHGVIPPRSRPADVSEANGQHTDKEFETGGDTSPKLLQDQSQRPKETQESSIIVRSPRAAVPILPIKPQQRTPLPYQPEPPHSSWLQNSIPLQVVLPPQAPLYVHMGHPLLRSQPTRPPAPTIEEMSSSSSESNVHSPAPARGMELDSESDSEVSAEDVGGVSTSDVNIDNAGDGDDDRGGDEEEEEDDDDDDDDDGYDDDSD